MVPWGFAGGSSAAAAAAARDLKKALEREGARDVRIDAAGGGGGLGGGGGVRVRATFSAGPLGLVSDEVDFLLSEGGVAAFRAASSSGGVYPFSDSGTALRRNRERLLRVRRFLFEKRGWQCACPPDADPFTAARCALRCE